MKKIIIINGPNINLLGKREINIYGKHNLEYINNLISDKAKEMDMKVKFFQSNFEGEIVDCIQRAYADEFDGIIINAGAYSHYSYAIRDAISSISLDVIEVHMSNVFNREKFRQKSVIAPVCIGQISGFGFKSYLMAMEYFNL